MYLADHIACSCTANFEVKYIYLRSTSLSLSKNQQLWKYMLQSLESTMDVNHVVCKRIMKTSWSTLLVTLIQIIIKFLSCITRKCGYLPLSNDRVQLLLTLLCFGPHDEITWEIRRVQAYQYSMLRVSLNVCDCSYSKDWLLNKGLCESYGKKTRKQI